MPYTERYVAFIDILGFSDIVRKTERDDTSSRYDTLVRALSEIGSRKEPTIEKLPQMDFRFQAFSDSIVMSSKILPGGLTHMLSVSSHFILRLLRNGFLIRGAISRGKLHHDDKVMFGPAFLDAYRIESTIAKYPRIILSRETYEDWQAMSENMSLTSSLRRLFPQVLLDADGPPYVHPFSLFRQPHHYLDLATDCQKMIEDLLNDSIYVPSHYEKLRWLATYWNATVPTASGELHVIEFPFKKNRN